MAEIVYKSPGVFTREIDNSQPTPQAGPISTPVGIIGTANLGPAFVPVTINSLNDLISIFGNIDGSSYGKIAAAEYLKNGGGSVAYVRVLGVGDGKQRNDNGTVTNAGFVVGNETIQSNGNFGSNPYANTGAGDVKGRTYFLGCFMSESNGSTIFSEAGIQKSGENISVPILRGVLLAPSGVALSLSGAFHNEVSQTPLLTTTATTDGSTPRYGQMTGSIEMAKSGSFTLLLNGFKGSSERESNVITASFDPTSIVYFADVLNTDPLKIEEHGHLLYSHYYIHPQMAEITGSGVIPNTISLTYENIAFILTGSNNRGISSGFNDVPDYEDFQDRFSHAETPYVISQNLGETYDLFKLVALSPGPEFATKYKFSILNIKPNEKTFSLIIRNADDVDGEEGIIESYNGLSLNPDSDFYIARIIGDFNLRYNFDNSESSQGILIEGSHPNQSKLVRVVISNDLKNGNVPNTAVPFGFRGPMHTVTSGSLMASYDGNFIESDVLQRIIEPPFPLRTTISSGEGFNKQAESKYYWGYQKEAKINVIQPNLFDNTTIEANTVYSKFYPTHRSDTTSFAVKENIGTADVNGSVLDVDRFNKNKFTLENVKVRTGSNGKADFSQWHSASYVRGGNISADDNLKTRALAVNDLTETGNQIYVKFTCLFQGGFNGVNIFDYDKSNLSNDSLKREYDNISDQGGVKSGPTIKSYRKALDILGSKSDIDIQLLLTPGIRHSSVTDYAISIAENRFDTMYIMDIEKYNSQNNLMTGSSDELPSIAYTTDAFLNRNLDTSFAAAYFPDVNINIQLSDGNIITKKVPPSIPVIGAYANNDAIGNTWFAPAGNTRGVLGSALSSELGTLTRSNLDKLYEADINPINGTINYGVVIQGQKTLLKNLSALDRINVRRLLIMIRRSVRNIANTIIFEPNRPETLNKFRALINPILENLKNQQGVARYKIVIDETTTTQADIENNTIRGKIYIQPVRVAEFIALDFNLTNNGTID